MRDIIGISNTRKEKNMTMSDWAIVYRQRNTGTWYPIAAFLLVSDAEDYKQRMNLLEPMRYELHYAPLSSLANMEPLA